MLLDDLSRVALLEQGQVRQQRRRLALEAGGSDVQQRAAADGDDGRVGADHEAIAWQRDDRGLQPEPATGGLAGLELLAIDQEHSRHHLLGAHMKAHPVALLERPRRVLQELERGIGEDRRQEPARRRDDVPALDGRPFHRLEVHRGALPRRCAHHGAAVHLEAAHLGPDAPRIHLEPIVHGEDAGGERPGDHGAEAPHREHAVDGEPGRLVGGLGRDGPGQLRERGTQLREPCPRLDRHRHDGTAAEEGGREQAPHVVAHQLDPVGVGQIGLGQGHQPRLDAQERADGQMLARLGHHALVGRDHEHDEVDAAHSGQHVLDEALVAGHVHDLDGGTTRLLEEGEAEVDGDPARFLLGQAVGVGAGQRLDERGLAVVDVPGRSHDHVLHAREMSRCASAGTSATRIVRQSSRRRSSTRRPSAGGLPARSASSSSRAGCAEVPRASAAVGSSTVGSAPPPTWERVSITSAPSARRVSAPRRRRSPRARRRMAGRGSVSILSAGIVSRALPAS